MKRALVLVAGLMLAPATAAQDAATPKAAQDAAKPTAAPETRSCLALRSIRDTNVVDNRTIDFTLGDGSVWRNRLPYDCPQLGFERAFSYQTSMSQLCKQDVITVIELTGSRQIGARCGLGEFVRQPPKAKTKAKP